MPSFLLGCPESEEFIDGATVKKHSLFIRLGVDEDLSLLEVRCLPLALPLIGWNLDWLVLVYSKEYLPLTLGYPKTDLLYKSFHP